jgi:hypothetical protein
VIKRRKRKKKRLLLNGPAWLLTIMKNKRIISIMIPKLKEMRLKRTYNPRKNGKQDSNRCMSRSTSNRSKLVNMTRGKETRLRLLGKSNLLRAQAYKLNS